MPFKEIKNLIVDLFQEIYYLKKLLKGEIILKNRAQNTRHHVKSSYPFPKKKQQKKKGGRF